MQEKHVDTYREEAHELLSELESSLLELEGSPGDMELVGRIFRAMHTIKGSGAMFGFDEIAAFTHEVETVFDNVRHGTLQVTRDLIDLTLKARDCIRLMLDEPDKKSSEEMAAAILSSLRALASGGESPIRTFWGPPKRFAGRVARPQQPRKDRRHTESVLPRPAISFVRAPTPFLCSTSCAALGNAALRRTSARSLPWKRSTRIVLRQVGHHPHDLQRHERHQGRLHLRGERRRDKHRAHRREPIRRGRRKEARGDTHREGGRRQAGRGKSAQGRKPIGELLVNQGQQHPPRWCRRSANRSISVKCGKTKVEEAVSSIRVSAEKLDKLVDLVGELVTIQARLTEKAGNGRDRDCSLWPRRSRGSRTSCGTTR